MASESILWDTNILYRWFQPEGTDYVDHIKKYLEESALGEVDIYISTITLAEIRPSAISKIGMSPLQVLSAISASFIPIDTSPDIMSLAGYLRDQRYREINVPESKASSRPLGTGDAIHLATAVALREEFGVQNLTLHSFDEGKSKSTEEGSKTVPILGFEKWCRDCADDEEIQKVISVPKKKPEHPACPLPIKNKPNAS